MASTDGAARSAAIDSMVVAVMADSPALGWQDALALAESMFAEGYRPGHQPGTVKHPPSVKEPQEGIRGHRLMPASLRAALPPLYANEEKSETEVMVIGKWFDPGSSWTWYLTEFDGDDQCFGLVVGHVAELGYFSYGEIAGLRNRMGIPIERDLHWTPKPLAEVRGS